MIRFLADENFDNDLIRGLHRRDSSVDILRVQDIGLSGADDELVLQAAADSGRVLLTHDVRTITAVAYARVKSGLSMPGVFEVAKGHAHGTIIDDLVLLANASVSGEWEGQVRYLPLR